MKKAMKKTILSEGNLEKIKDLDHRFIDQTAQLIYSRMELFLSDDDGVNYEKLRDPFLRTVVRCIPAAVDIQERCETLLSASSMPVVYDLLWEIYTVVESSFRVRIATLLFFDETQHLYNLTSGAASWGILQRKDRLTKSKIDDNIKSRNAQEQLNPIFASLGYSSQRSQVISEITGKLASACESFVMHTENLLSSRSKSSAFVSFCNMLFMLLELQARCYEYGYVFMGERLYDN